MVHIAYGPNLNPMFLRRRCPSAVHVGESSLSGYVLEFRSRLGKVFVTIQESENDTDTVPVVLWQVTETDERALDRYTESLKYFRKEHTVVICKGKRQAGFLYVLNGGELAFPSKDYFDCIQRGYDYARFDIGTLHEALRRVNPSKYDSIKEIVNKRISPQ